MKGFTFASTSSIVAGAAKAPSGVYGAPTRAFSADAWRASTEWIERAAARISGL